LFLLKVRKRRKPEPPEVAADDDNFYKDFKELLDDEEHMDAVFLIHRDNNVNENTNASPVALINSKIKTEFKTEFKTESDSIGSSNLPNATSSSSSDHENFIQIRAHRAILTARAEYFKALFRTNATSIAVGKSKVVTTTNTTGTAFRESEDCSVRVEPIFTEQHVRYVLEFLYTNRIQQIHDISTDDLLFLLDLSDRWLLRDLKRYVEHEMIRSHISNNTVARMYGATEQFSAKRLSQACFEYIMTNLRSLATNANFLSEMKNYPHLCIPVLKAAADLIPDGPVHKKQRTDHHSNNRSGSNNDANNTASEGTPSSAGAPNLRSSPVPDSDT
jgi:BTB/POZ domain